MKGGDGKRIGKQANKNSLSPCIKETKPGPILSTFQGNFNKVRIP